MHSVDITKLCKTDYDVTFLNSLSQYWQDTKAFSCLDNPKKQNIFLFLIGCQARYVTKDKKVLHAKENDIIYAPQGSEYSVELFGFQSEQSRTIGINFFLYDQHRSLVTLFDDVEIFSPAGPELQHLFHKVEQLKTNISAYPTEHKLLLFKIINTLSKGREESQSATVIRPGMDFLAEHCTEDVSVLEAANACHISEVYFRKRFKEQLGMSPLAYKNHVRLELAKQYLQYGEISVREVAEALGYATDAHFIKQFKQKYGISPLAYRKRATK